MGSLSKNIQVELEFLKSPFLVLHFSYYTLMTFLIMLSVILLSMLMIVLFTLSVIRHLICGNRKNWVLNLNLIYETLWTGVGSGFLVSVLEKLTPFCLTNLIFSRQLLIHFQFYGVAISLKMNESVLEEKLPFNKLGLTFQLLNWIRTLTLSLQQKLPPRKLVF